MTSDDVMKALEALGSERTKTRTLKQGAKEPLFGVALGAMKPLFKSIGIDQALAEALYASGNYDAMVFAGMIADPRGMTQDDFNRWMNQAYFYMISDYVVAVTLSESPIAQTVADAWIDSYEDLHQSAGYSCYCWLLGSQQDHHFDQKKIQSMLERIKATIHSSSNRCRYAMNQFVMTVGISYRPLHAEALAVAQAIGPVEVLNATQTIDVYNAERDIIKAIEKKRIGFKRNYVRC